MKIASIAPARAEAVARRALRRRDRRAARVLLAERDLDHLRLGRVAERRRGGVRVDVADLGRIDAGVGDRHPHRARRALAGRVGLGHVRRVDGHAVAEQLRVDLRAARLGAARAPRARAPPPASPITSPSRPLSNGRDAPCRIVVAARERPHRVEAGDRRPRVTGASRAAGEHRVGAAEPDRVERVADRHVRGGARGALAHQRPLRAELDRDPAGAHVRDDASGSRTG